MRPEHSIWPNTHLEYTQQVTQITVQTSKTNYAITKPIAQSILRLSDYNASDNNRFYYCTMTPTLDSCMTEVNCQLQGSVDISDFDSRTFFAHPGPVNTPLCLMYTSLWFAYLLVPYLSLSDFLLCNFLSSAAFCAQGFQLFWRNVNHALGGFAQI